MTQFNSIAVLAFSIDHESEDGSDITPTMLWNAVNRRISDLNGGGAGALIAGPDRSRDNLEWIEACLPVSDTYENEDGPCP